jgi:hypothetical protein
MVNRKFRKYFTDLSNSVEYLLLRMVSLLKFILEKSIISASIKVPTRKRSKQKVDETGKIFLLIFL